MAPAHRAAVCPEKLKGQGVGCELGNRTAAVGEVATAGIGQAQYIRGPPAVLS
jgi:hypothetical protein